MYSLIQYSIDMALMKSFIKIKIPGLQPQRQPLPIAVRPGMPKGAHPHPTPVRLPGPRVLAPPVQPIGPRRVGPIAQPPGPRGLAPPALRAIAPGSPLRTNQASPGSSPAAKRQDVKATPTRPRLTGTTTGSTPQPRPGTSGASTPALISKSGGPSKLIEHLK